MSRIAAPGLVLALSAALAVSGLTRSAPAEEAYDPEDTVYATGAVFETEDELADVPRTPLFRAYLPPSVDLSGRFPPAGDQGGKAHALAGRSATRPAPTTTARTAEGDASRHMRSRARPTSTMRSEIPETHATTDRASPLPLSF